MKNSQGLFFTPTRQRSALSSDCPKYTYAVLDAVPFPVRGKIRQFFPWNAVWRCCMEQKNSTTQKIDESFHRFSNCNWKTFGMLENSIINTVKRPDVTNTGKNHAFPVNAFSIIFSCLSSGGFNSSPEEWILETRAKKSINARAEESLSWIISMPQPRFLQGKTFASFSSVAHSLHEPSIKEKQDDNFLLNFWWKYKKCMPKLVLRGAEADS